MARAISIQAANAFYRRNLFTCKNTRVTMRDGNICLFLFGNLIAYATDENVYFTLAGYNTPTTRERLNVLWRRRAPLGSGSAAFHTIQGVAYFNGHVIDVNTWYDLEALLTMSSKWGQDYLKPRKVKTIKVLTDINTRQIEDIPA